MFGDLFSQRGDYLDGMFYRGHMKYLREQNPQEAAPTLMPPDEFKTRRQLRHLKKVGEGNSGQNFHIKFQKKEDEGHHHHGHGAARFKKSAHIIQDLIMLEHFSSNHEQDWIQRLEAGVVIWINKGTGEVSTVRPWGDDSTPKHDVSSIARIHPQLLKSKSGTNDILHRISMLKDHDSLDHKSTSSPRPGVRHTISASPRPGIKPSSSSSPRTVTSARPSTSSSPRMHNMRITESKSESKSESRRHDAEAKRDLRYLEPETKSEYVDSMAHYDEYLRDAEEMEHELGTGALVYDGSEVDNFFVLLDGMK